MENKEKLYKAELHFLNGNIKSIWPLTEDDCDKLLGWYEDPQNKTTFRFSNYNKKDHYSKYNLLFINIVEV